MTDKLKLPATPGMTEASAKPEHEAEAPRAVREAEIFPPAVKFTHPATGKGTR